MAKQTAKRVKKPDRAVLKAVVAATRARAAIVTQESLMRNWRKGSRATVAKNKQSYLNFQEFRKTILDHDDVKYV